jgi:hypothetical protein
MSRPAGWTKLVREGPGHDAVVTLTDGTLRGGWIASVDMNALRLESSGKTLALEPSDVATVRIKRPDHTLLGGAIGYLVAGTAVMLLVDQDQDLDAADKVIMFGVGGLPGAALGAWFGHFIGGDMEIVP